MTTKRVRSTSRSDENDDIFDDKIPIVVVEDGGWTRQQHIFDAYNKYQAVLIRPRQPSSSSSRTDESTSVDKGKKKVFSWRDIQSLYQNLNEQDQESFCLESESLSSTAAASSSASPSASAAATTTKTDDRAVTMRKTACEFLQPLILKDKVAYCSFLVQHDTSSLEHLLERLPVTEILNNHNGSYDIGPTTAVRSKEDNNAKNDDVTDVNLDEKSDKSKIMPSLHHEPCVWIFFGRNHCNIDDGEEEQFGEGTTRRDLQGRPEHTDSISHDGTWHYQLSGTKRWFIRPTTKLLDYFKKREEQSNGRQNKKIRSNTEVMDSIRDTKSEGEDAPMKATTATDMHSILVDCQEGDVFILNTRLWYHQTVLPPQPDPSVSYARDFWLKPERSSDTTNHTEATSTSKSPGCKIGTNASTGTASTTMSNVDGLYATEDIEEGTVIFREDTMPDVELHRSATNPNCDVVEVVDENGSEIQAVVSTRSIAAGEFFCIPASDDDDEEGCEDADDDYNDEEM
jgi:U3 small nucleolar RNA-associated protein 6